MIDDTEIGLAILYSSLKQHCNASFLPEDHESQTKKIKKMTSQTQDFLFDNQMELGKPDEDEEESEDEKPTRKRHHMSEILDSAQFQYENKCTDLMVVTETQNLSNTSINKDLVIDVSILKEPETKISKLLNDVVVPDTLENDFFVKPIEPPKKSLHTTQALFNESELKFNDQTTKLTNNSIKQSFNDDSHLQKENKVQKSTSKKEPITSTFKNVKQELKPLNESSIKTESKIFYEKLPSKVYSKQNPPKESFIVKRESQVSFEIF